MSRPKLAAVVGGIVGASLLAFCAGLLLTVSVIVPARREAGLSPLSTSVPAVTASPSIAIGPVASSTPTAQLPTASPPAATSTSTPLGSESTPGPSTTATTEEQATATSSPTPTESGFPFYYVEGSRVEDLQCTQPYLQGWIRDADGAPLSGVTIRWQYWNNAEYAVSGDPRLVWQPGEFKFTYYAENPNLETDFVLQVVESADNPVPLSAPLEIHYLNCGTMGQITNIVFRRR
jgi:hypothetical protein